MLQSNVPYSEDIKTMNSHEKWLCHWSGGLDAGFLL
jgi:hypothetical protein